MSPNDKIKEERDVFKWKVRLCTAQFAPWRSILVQYQNGEP